MDVKIFRNADDLARGAAEYFVARSIGAVAQTGKFSVTLSGGATPRLLYQLLAAPNQPFREQVSWDAIHFFWSDERHVPPDHPDNNYRMANEAMLSRVPVSPDHVHRIPSENPSAADAARSYEETLLEFFCRGGPPWPPQPQHHREQGHPRSIPQLDLILLGLGTDGHTASIFPGSEVLNESTRLVAAAWVEKLKSYRLTMTLPLLNNATSVLFLISGFEKAEIVREVLQDPPDKYPAQAVKPPNGELLWMLDSEAASKLSPQERETR